MVGCSPVAVLLSVLFVILAIFFNLPADLHSRDFSSVITSVFVFATGLYSIVVILAQSFFHLQ